MAPPAAEPLRRRPRDLVALLAPFPGRTAATTRIAAASTLTVLISAIYGTPEAAISAYVIFFINRADRTSSIVMSVAALVLVSIIIGLVILLADFTVDIPMLRVACMALVSAALLFLTSASKLRPIGAILAMIIGFGLDELGLVPAGELATRALLYAWLMVAIPIGANVVVNLVMGPSPRRLACDRLAQCLRVAAQVLRAGHARSDVPPDGVQPVAGWLKLARLEGTVNAADYRALQQAATSTTAILMAVDVTGREPAAQLPRGFAMPMADTVDAMASMLEKGGYPVDIEVSIPDASLLTPVQQSIVAALRSAIEGYAEGFEEKSPASLQAEKTGGLLDADAFTNRSHIHYALKTTGAAMFCYLLYQQLNWPGIHTCFITCYLVSLGTMAETVEKLTLRLTGCLVGAVAGTAAIVYVVPELTSVGGLLTLVFVGTWLSAWVAQGSPRIAYAGFQIAFAFYLCVIQGAGPGFDLTIARDRVIGIIIGNLVVYLVFTRIWPVSIASRIETGFVALLRQWQQLVDARPSSARRQHAIAALALQGSVAQDLQLARYEPASVGPGTDWIEDRRKQLSVLDAIAGPLFLLAERCPGDPAIADRLRRLQSMDAPIPTTGHTASASADDTHSVLLAMVDRSMARPSPGDSTSSPSHAQT